MQLDSLVSGDLTIRGSKTETSIVLTWAGKSNDRQPARAIIPYVAGCLDHARDGGLPMEMQFGALEHMNSSTITTVIQIIQEARSRNVKMLLTYAATKRWQKLGFEALQVFVKPDGLLRLAATPESA